MTAFCDMINHLLVTITVLGQQPSLKRSFYRPEYANESC